MNVFSAFLMVLITTRSSSVQAQTEMVEEWWSESLHRHLNFPQNNNFLH